MLELLSKGGWVMLPLIICSLAALTIIIERLIWGPTVERVLPARFRQDALELASSGRVEELAGLCRATNSAPARLLLAALSHADRSETSLRQAVEAAGKDEALKLQRFIGTLGTIAAISPLLGLLGTVFGMIETFRLIEADGVGNAAHLAGGISEALITTAAGMTIAIPTLVFHRFFLHRVRTSVAALERFSVDVVEQLQRSTVENPPETQRGVAR